VKRDQARLFCGLAVIVAVLAYDAGHGILALGAIALALAAFPT